MNAPQALPPTMTGFAPDGMGVSALLEHGTHPAALPNPEPLSLPPQAPLGVEPSPITSIATTSSPWRPSAVVGSVLASSMRRRWELYAAQLQECQMVFSEETVHELRVASRRLMAQFVMAGCVASGKTSEKACRILKNRLKALGELRDIQVQRLFIERRLARYPELLLVRDTLRRRERKLKKAAAAKVRGFKKRKLKGWALALEQDFTRQSGSSRRQDRLANTIARATGQAFAEVVKRRRAINRADAATIHRTRIAFKKFRYMVESLSPDLTGLGRGDLRLLARYQRRMGILQDLEVLQRSIQGFTGERPGMEALLQPFIGYLRRSRERALRTFLSSADELLQFWPPDRAQRVSILAVTKDAA